MRTPPFPAPHESGVAEGAETTEAPDRISRRPREGDGDERAVDLLDGLLTGRGFLGRKEPPEIRAAAALGLGKVGTPPAREALEKARGETDPVIRSAVSRALKGEDSVHE